MFSEIIVRDSVELLNEEKFVEFGEKLGIYIDLDYFYDNFFYKGLGEGDIIILKSNANDNFILMDCYSHPITDGSVIKVGVRCNTSIIEDIKVQLMDCFKPRSSIIECKDELLKISRMKTVLEVTEAFKEENIRPILVKRYIVKEGGYLLEDWYEKMKEINYKETDTYTRDVFEKDLNRAIRMYFNDSNINTSSIRDQINTELDDTYGKCAQMKHLYEKKRYIFNKLDEKFYNTINKVTLANRLLIDRYPDKALELIMRLDESRQLINDPYYNIVYANILIVKGKYDEAIEKARRAYSFEPENDKAKLILADALYMKSTTEYDNHGYLYFGYKYIEEAHGIYEPLLQKFFDEVNNDAIINPLVELVGFDGNRLYSPLLAMLFLNDYSIHSDVWKWAKNEYYHYPFFRYKYAIMLYKKGESKLEVTKMLLELIKEMPWFERAPVFFCDIYNRLSSDEQNKIEIEDVSFIRELYRKYNIYY